MSMIGTYYPSFERKVLDSGYVLLMNRSVHSSRTIPNFHVLLYILSGEWDIQQEGEYFRLKKDDVILMHAGLHHEGKNPAPIGTKTLYLHFSALPEDFPESKESGTLVQTLTHCESNPRIRQLMERICELTNNAQKHNELKESAMLTELLCELSESRTPRNHSYNDFAQSVMEVFNNNRDRFFSGKQLENEFGLDIKTINKRFYSECGESVYRYQLRTRLKDVYNYLEFHPNIKMNELAEMFGFCDEYHLSRVFKKEYGLTPSQHRSNIIKR